MVAELCTVEQPLHISAVAAVINENWLAEGVFALRNNTVFWSFQSFHYFIRMSYLIFYNRDTALPRSRNTACSRVLSKTQYAVMDFPDETADEFLTRKMGRIIQ